MSHISQIKVGDTASTISVPYGTCTTAAATAAKTVAITGFTQDAGTSVRVKFTYANTAATPTLNVNSQGAKPIVGYGTTAPTTSWKAGSIVDFTYDGTSWVMTGFGAIAEVTRAATTLTSSADSTNAKLTFTAGNNQSTGFVTGSNSTATKTVTLTADGAKVTASDGTNSVEKSVATVTRADTTLTSSADTTNAKLTFTASNNQATGYVTGANKTATKTVTLSASGASVTASDGTNSVSKSVAIATRADTTISAAADASAGKITFTASNNQATGYVTGANKTASAAATLSVSGPTATVSYGTATVSKSVTTMTLPTATDASAASGSTTKATIGRSTADSYINIPTGYNTAAANYKISAVANGTVSAADSSISGGSFTPTLSYATATDNFTFSGSANATGTAHAKITKDGYLTSSSNTSKSLSATVSATGSVNKIATGVTISGTTTKAPTLKRTAKPTADTWTDAASGAATTTKPTSGVYVQIDADANTGTLTATPKVTGAGYGTTTNYGATAGTATVGAAAATTAYVPITTMTLPTSVASTADGTNKATIGRSTSDQYINIPAGYNGSKASYKVSAVANGVEGTPTASITTAGSSSNSYTAKVTPKVTNTTGYITATSGGKSGTAINVTPTNLGLTKRTALSVIGDTVSIPAGSYTESQLTATVEMQDAEYASNVMATEYTTGGVPLVSMPGYTGNKQLDYLNIPAGTAMAAGIEVNGTATVTNNGTTTATNNSTAAITNSSTGSMTVSNAGTITNLSSSNKITTETNTGTITTLNNNKTITALNNTGSISTTSTVGTLTNSVYATITTINNAAASSTISTINNSGTITTINNNSGTVGAINNKSGASVTNINNSGTINALTNAGNITRSFNGIATSTSDYTYGTFGTIDNTCGTIDINNIGFSDADGALEAVVTVSNINATSTATKTKVSALPSTNNSSDRISITKTIAENKVFMASPFAGAQTYKTILSASSNKYVWIKSSIASTTSAPIIACAATTGQKTIDTTGVCLSTATTSTQLGTAAGSVASFFVIGPSTVQYYVGLSSSASAKPATWSNAFYLGTVSTNRYCAFVSMLRVRNNKTEVYCTLPVANTTLDS